VVGARRSSWRVISSIEQKTEGSEKLSDLVATSQRESQNRNISVFLLEHGEMKTKGSTKLEQEMETQFSNSLLIFGILSLVIAKERNGTMMSDYVSTDQTDLAKETCPHFGEATNIANRCMKTTMWDSPYLRNNATVNQGLVLV